MSNGTARRVVCAAIRAADGEVLIGIRHYDALMHRQIERRVDGSKFKHRPDEDQGFVDQHGEFMNREDAFAVAALAGQRIEASACGVGWHGVRLYSEGLY